MNDIAYTHVPMKVLSFESDDILEFSTGYPKRRKGIAVWKTAKGKAIDTFVISAYNKNRSTELCRLNREELTQLKFLIDRALDYIFLDDII